MTRHYTTRDFFRQMPNALLKRYFEERGLFGELDFSAMKEGKPDALFDAWLSLPEDQRHTMDAELRDIFEMSCEKGFHAIVDETRWQWRREPEARDALIEKLSALPSHHHRAMVTYLDHGDFWRGATRFYHADSLSYWRKRKHMGHNPAAVDKASLDQLAAQIRTYFRTTEGRGNNCIVEAFRRDERDYFFAYPEDYSQQSIEWVDGEFDRRPHNPAFEVVCVYTQKDGTLDLNYRGTKKAVEPLQGMFATTILKLDELPPDPTDERVYDLNPLAQASFDFSFAVGSGIENVVVKKLRLSSRAHRGDRITLEADAAHDPNAVYALLEKVRPSLPLHTYNVTQVELTASVVTDPDKPARTVTIRITHPNSCSLKYDEMDLKLRQMLEASGIEPREADTDEASVTTTEA
jgi:hypothetical protein